MMRSMTGYGKTESTLEGKKIVVEIKSLNHRYLEVSLRLPAALFPLEMEIKKKINSIFARGKIEVTVRMDGNGTLAQGGRLDLNLPLLRSYYALLTRMKQELNLPDEVTLAMMAGFKDLFVSQEDNELPPLWEKVDVMLDEATAMLMVMRKKEGAALCQDLSERIAGLGHRIDEIEGRVPRVLAAYQKRLQERIKELAGDREVDESRLMQEIAIMAEKSDITEEIVRFRSHVDQFTEMLKSDEAMGRKIDFLIQEMVREVNTIGSKSSDVEISRSVIDIKSELARIREQVQNLE